MSDATRFRPTASSALPSAYGYLETHGLADGDRDFEQSTKTAQMAADAAGCELGQIVKSLVFTVDGTPRPGARRR